ncbi:MAG: tetratricopeptide repeat protein [Candidatus Saccharibacteria bacterium]|nr:tetratricopeptide repeat protein [Candidatus Saccharibacteria bacterium]
MLGILFIFVFLVYLCFFHPLFPSKEESLDPKYTVQLKKLWSIAQAAMKEHKPLRAEKALLTILKLDEKNAAAYNRLGILYAKEQRYESAIECFEIAQSLDNNASSLHNVGLIYLETGAYEKASMAFEQALKLEGDVPARYIALAKAEEKLGRRKSALVALESAYELDRSTGTLRQILALHESAGDSEAIASTTLRIEEQLAEDARQRELSTKSRKKPLITAHPKQVRRAPRIFYPKSTPKATPTPNPTSIRPAPTTKTIVKKRPSLRRRKVIQ